MVCILRDGHRVAKEQYVFGSHIHPASSDKIHPKLLKDHQHTNGLHMLLFNHSIIQLVTKLYLDYLHLEKRVQVG